MVERGGPMIEVEPMLEGTFFDGVAVYVDEEMEVEGRWREMEYG